MVYQDQCNRDTWTFELLERKGGGRIDPKAIHGIEHFGNGRDEVETCRVALIWLQQGRRQREPVPPHADIIGDGVNGF
jgi:hypothetical protein